MSKPCIECAREVNHTLHGYCLDCHTPVLELRELPGPWVHEGLCSQVDPDLWYPERGSGGSKAAKEICRKCPVRLLCLEHAMRTEEIWGVWGGLTEKERRRLRKKKESA